MVSVIIDNYNYARFLKDAINSVINQTYPDWELILVDDGSSDDSVRIMNEFAEMYPEKVRVVEKKNGGQASCFNSGFEVARGDIIAFLDSDDYWFPDKLKKIVIAHDGHGFVAHEKEFSDGTKQNIYTEYSSERTRLIREYGVMDSLDITTSTMSLKRGLAEKVFPMPESEFRICADHYVNFAATFYETVEYLHEKLSFYRIHGANGFVTQSSEKKSTFASQALDYACVERLNEKLARERVNERIPHRSIRLTEMMWKDIGEGFEILKGYRYVIYGTGNDSFRFARAVTDREGVIVAFCDSNPEKQGKLHYAKEVWSPGELLEKRDDFDRVIAASIQYYPEMVRKMEEMGLSRGRDFIFTPVF